jgi:hypothetical protein
MRTGLRVVVAVAALAAAGTFAAAAGAQEIGGELVTHHHTYESAQNFNVELRFSPFYPDVDSDPSLGPCTPFADIFGKGASVMFGGEFDWQAIRIKHLGTFGPGAGIGFVQFNAMAPYAPTSTGGRCVTSTGSVSGENTSLSIYPVWVVGVLRADVLWKEAGIPFVPYAKLGLAGAFWQAGNTLGTSNYNGDKGQGVTMGSALALGLSFNLNVFDEYAARQFDEGVGVNGTYLFAEWTDLNLNGLWVQNNPMRVGGTSWTFGMAWEF